METPAISAFGDRQRQLLGLLLETKAGLTADELAAKLEVSRSAVHQHLSALESDGHVEKTPLASKGGRPGFAWRLTDRGIHLFPKQYALFSQLLIRGMKERLGSDELVHAMRALGATLAGQHAHRLAGKNRKAQIEEVARIMRELGYQSRAEHDPGHALPILDARNCIYHNLAREHPEVCQLDLALLGKLLDADIEHVECMVRGGRACRFRVLRQRKKKSAHVVGSSADDSGR
ncbi:MAG: helix-turn-helix transcriptional regulator [Gammaproteobacteria bacterium]